MRSMIALFILISSIAWSQDGRVLDSLAVECLKHCGPMVEGDTLSAEADRITSEMMEVAPPTFDPQLEGSTFTFKITCSNCIIAGAVITREQGVISHAKIEEGDGFHTMSFSDAELDGKVLGYQIVTEKVMISGAYKLVDGVLSHDRTMYVGRRDDGSFIFHFTFLNDGDVKYKVVE